MGNSGDCESHEIAIISTVSVTVAIQENQIVGNLNITHVAFQASASRKRPISRDAGVLRGIGDAWSQVRHRGILRRNSLVRNGPSDKRHRIVPSTARRRRTAWHQAQIDAEVNTKSAAQFRSRLRGSRCIIASILMRHTFAAEYM
jgi:hypothetical protein